MSICFPLETIESLARCLSEIANETPDYKKNLRKKMSNINQKIFKKKNVDACCRLISEKMRLNLTVKGFDFEKESLPTSIILEHEDKYFFLSFIAAYLEVKFQKDVENFNEEELFEFKKLCPFMNEDDKKELIKSKETWNKGCWFKQNDEILCEVMRNKYPQLFIQKESDSENNVPKLRIKWKDVCASFKEKTNNTTSNQTLGKNCRERWINYLNPNLNRGEWTEEEDKTLLFLSWKFKRRWCLIEGKLNSRTQHSLKNRFFHLIATNLHITNKSSIKRKNLSADIARILIKKYNYALPVEKKIKKKKLLSITRKMKPTFGGKRQEKELMRDQKIDLEGPKIKREVEGTDLEKEKDDTQTMTYETSFKKIEESIINTNNVFNNFRMAKNDMNPFFLFPRTAQMYYEHQIYQKQLWVNYQNALLQNMLKTNYQNLMNNSFFHNQ